MYLLSAMFIPFPVIILPLIKQTALLGLDNPAGVVFLHVLGGISFNTLLYIAFVRSIPVELEESARMDGATTWQVFRKIIFPLLAPMNATVGIFAFLGSWNDFLLPQMMIADPALQTLPVVQMLFQGEFNTNYSLAFASYLMAMAPTLVVYSDGHRGGAANDAAARRVVELARQAELYGFSHVWTFDCHILWEEPFVIYTQILAQTRKVIVGPMVTNPATRDWTVTASLFATLNEMFGNRTICGIGRGDSAVRVTNGKPTTLATLREAVHVIRELANGREVDYKGSTLRFPWATQEPRSTSGSPATGRRRSRSTGEVGDGFILQLADPDITAWTINAVGRRRRAAGRDPDDVKICVAAPAYVGDDLAHGRDQCRWFGGMVGNHVADIVERYGDGGGACPQALTDYIKGRAGLRLQRARPGRQHAHAVRARRDRRPLLHPRAGRPARRSGSKSSRRSASTSSPSTCSTTPRTRRCGPTARRVIPAVAEQCWPRRDDADIRRLTRAAAPGGDVRRVAACSSRVALGALQGGRARGRRHGLRAASSCHAPSDRAMPHVWDMVAAVRRSRARAVAATRSCAGRARRRVVHVPAGAGRASRSASLVGLGAGRR